jgi:purine-nucleoside/S-methyl-5'-thioadenosine phosphorylase / adenosine deaminase
LSDNAEGREVRLHQSANLKWYESQLLAGCGIRAALSTRSGGCSSGAYQSLNMALHVGDQKKSVLENRSRHWRALGLDPATPIGIRQVHGTDIEVVGRHQLGRGASSWDDIAAQADGLVTFESGLPLFALCADCFLVVLARPDGDGLALLHAGWRGLLGGIIQKGTELLCKGVGRGKRIKADKLLVCVGPGLGPEHFEVGDDFREHLCAVWGAGADREFISQTRERKLFFRYQDALRRELIRVDIQPGNTEFVEVSTAEENGEFYSHRASGGQTGRMSMTTWLPEA